MCLRLSVNINFSNMIIFETSWSIEINFHFEHHVVGEKLHIKVLSQIGSEKSK